MKTLKMLLVAIAITVSSATYAKPVDGGKGSRVSAEIEKMLSESNLIVENDFVVTVIFKVNEDMKIEIRSITSPNQKVNDFLRQRLQDQKLQGSAWTADKIYELPVKVEAKR